MLDSGFAIRRPMLVELGRERSEAVRFSPFRFGTVRCLVRFRGGSHGRSGGRKSEKKGWERTFVGGWAGLSFFSSEVVEDDGGEEDGADDEVVPVGLDAENIYGRDNHDHQKRSKKGTKDRPLSPAEARSADDDRRDDLKLDSGARRHGCVPVARGRQ